MSGVGTSAPVNGSLDRADELAIGRLIELFYSAFDNRHGRAPDFVRLREAFSPAARIVRVSRDGAEDWDLDGFLEPRQTLLTEGSLTDFHEWEVTARTFGGGSIAGRWSEYQKRGVLDGAEFRGAGRKLIQLHKTGDGWRIVSILWEDEPGTP